VPPQRAEVYVEGDDGPLMFCIAFMRNAFMPEEGSLLALVDTGDGYLVVRPDQKTSSLIGA
jgi:hypothetical protein